MATLQVTTGSSQETERLGAIVGSLLQPGFFLALYGTLGGGKTCFARGLVVSVAPQSAHLVASPTYAIMNCYPGNIPVYHFDFYRLAGDDDIAELGFEDYFYGEGVCVAEWAERLSGLLPPDSLSLNFVNAGEDARQITITSCGQKSDVLLEQLDGKLLQQKNL